MKKEAPGKSQKAVSENGAPGTHEESGEAITSLREENRSLRAELEFVKAIVAKQSDDITLKKNIVDQEKRPMENNVLFHNLDEKQGEICEEVHPTFPERIRIHGKH